MRRVVLATVVVVVSSILGGDAVAASAPSRTAAGPSKTAKMICNREGQNDIAELLGGVKPLSVTTPTWSRQVYSCNYVYPSGVVTLSVHELRTRAATAAYFASLGDTLGKQPDILSLGEGAFRTANGLVVVRKDTKVLVVDVSQLTFGPGATPIPSADAADNIATAIVGCWTGA